ncbi:MAG: proton-translocating transhydrogenase family protein [Holosporales bacterium]|jgi:NAD(P) transhydrogenase subunit alpha|nr:proton-translocating transhydrogenase family protein [Holosporales bacterium]
MLNAEMITIFILACFVGYYVVLKVTPALHAPLMSVTNAISSVIIVVALDAVLVGLHDAERGVGASVWFGAFAVLLAAVNIVGGFMLTRRMLSMFASKKKRSTEKRS